MLSLMRKTLSEQNAHILCPLFSPSNLIQTEFICREEFETCEVIEDCCSGLICLGEECVRPETELPTLR